MPSLDAIPTKAFNSELVALIEAAPLPGLAEGPSCDETADRISSVCESINASQTLTESALWLLAGELERSHEISQDHGSAEGSFWHGIMHRREGDYGNSKYWFRRVGSHSVHDELANLIANRADSLKSGLSTSGLTDSSQVAETLVDLCQQAASQRPEWKEDVQQICWWEWQLLFAHCS